MQDTDKSANNILTEDDIRNLIKSPADKRLYITKKIAHFYSNGGFGKEQMEIAEKIFRTLLKDTEVEIRKTLSAAIKHSDKIPQDVVLALARDVNEVSIPVLEFSQVLTDADLIEIINTTEDISKQESVTRRKVISEKVSGALIETGNEKIVGSLLSNNGAKISDDNFSKIIEDFSDRETIMGSLVAREQLSVHVIENITRKISEELYKKLSETHKDSMDKIAHTLKKSEEVATMKVIGMQSSEEYFQFCQLMKKLHIADDLMPISALCIGNFNLFEVCMARIIKVPVVNVRKLLMDPANKGFKVLYEKANLPKNLYEATEILIDVLREMKDELQGGIFLSKNIAHRILGNIMIRVEERGTVENIDYIVALIQHNADLKH
jgi:uncharacterized protein (DUF2336 family)